MISACTQSLENYLNPDCGDPVPLAGGIEYLVFGDSDIDTTSATPITDKTSASQWQAALNAGAVQMVGPILGEAPEATANEKKVSSCSPAKATNYTRQINFEDFNTTTDNTDFWNNIKAYAAGRKFGYVSCSGHFYGFVEKFTVTVSRVIDQSNEDGDTKWMGNVKYTKFNEETPAAFPSSVLFA